MDQVERELAGDPPQARRPSRAGGNVNDGVPSKSPARRPSPRRPRLQVGQHHLHPARLQRPEDLDRQHRRAVVLARDRKGRDHQDAHRRASFPCQRVNRSSVPKHSSRPLGANPKPDQAVRSPEHRDLGPDVEPNALQVAEPAIDIKPATPVRSNSPEVYRRFCTGKIGGGRNGACTGRRACVPKESSRHSPPRSANRPHRDCDTRPTSADSSRPPPTAIPRAGRTAPRGLPPPPPAIPRPSSPRFLKTVTPTSLNRRHNRSAAPTFDHSLAVIVISQNRQASELAGPKVFEHAHDIVHPLRSPRSS